MSTRYTGALLHAVPLYVKPGNHGFNGFAKWRMVVGAKALEPSKPKAILDFPERLSCVFRGWEMNGENGSHAMYVGICQVNCRA